MTKMRTFLSSYLLRYYRSHPLLLTRFNYLFLIQIKLIPCFDMCEKLLRSNNMIIFLDIQILSLAYCTHMCHQNYLFPKFIACILYYEIIKHNLLLEDIIKI